MLVLVTVLAPMGAGIAVRRIAPAFAGRNAGRVSLAATLLLVASALPIVVTAWPAIVSLIGNGTLVATAALFVAGLVSGHLLGGPDPEDRTILALSTASRHPGVAIAIAHATFPDQKLSTAAVVLYLLVGGIVGIPYVTWARRTNARRSDALGVGP